MSTVGLKLVTLLCLSCSALSAPEKKVEWRKPGESVSIKCRSPDKTEELELCKDLCKLDKVIYMHSQGASIVAAYQSRTLIRGTLPNVDIIISNLTSGETGQYWCMYQKLIWKTGSFNETCRGSVLLVVTEEEGPSGKARSDNQGLLLAFVISVAVLLFFIVGISLWLVVKTKTYDTTQKPRRVATNEVYEDMRGTIRR